MKNRGKIEEDHKKMSRKTFFLEVGLHWDPGTQAHWPIAYTSHLNSQGAIQESNHLTEGHDSAQLAPFFLFWIHPGKAQGLHPYLFQHRVCTDVSFSAPQLLHEGGLALPILCSMYCRLICPVRSPTNILKCFLSGLLMK